MFTKTQLREKFPGVSQIDRRVRDLRKVGWTIHEYRDADGLSPDEQRLVAVGEHVWEPGFRWPKSLTVPGNVARAVFDRDHNRCVVCGVSAGEEYPEEPGKIARLTVGHLIPKQRRGSTEDVGNFRTECARCNESARHLTAAPVDQALLQAEIQHLPPVRAPEARGLDH